MKIFKLIPNNTNLDFLSLRYMSFFVSVIITISTFLGLYTKGLNLGIDFEGGIILEIKTEKKLNSVLIRQCLEENGYDNPIIQSYDINKASIRLHSKIDNNYQEEISVLKNALLTEIDQNVQFNRIDYVGPRISGDMVKNSLKAFISALVVIMIYVWIRFNWKFGMCALISLFHDIVATIGFFLLTKYEFNITSIAAILTVVGYSINDSVVIYDRIREKMKKLRKNISIKLINASINETLSRTIMTFLTTFLASIALGIFGGENLKSFGMSISFGIAFGTYSSIFISTALLPYFYKSNVTK